MPLVAGVDLSTQSTTVEVRDLRTGEIIGVGRAPHPVTTPPVSEQHPEVWWAAFETAWVSIGAPEVGAIAVAGQQHGAVVLDAAGDVVRPALLWNDTRSAPDAVALRDRLGPMGWAESIGSVPVAAFTIAKLAWLRRTEPESWARLDRVMLPHDWLTARLGGRLGPRGGAVEDPTTDRGDASGTGYWSANEACYRFDLLDLVDPAIDWEGVVPRVVGPHETVGEWQGALIGPGTGDNMGAALGLALRAGEAVVSIGTSGTVYARSSRPTADASGAVAGFADATGAFLPLVCTLNAAKVLDAVRRILGADHDEFDRLALDAPSGGVTVVPYFDGERVPDLPDASGRIVGLRSDVTREQLARATVEGVVCGLLDGLDALRAHASVDRVVLTGGASRSRAVQAVIAALSDVPVAMAEVDEAVATGACVQAAATMTGSTTDEISAQWGLDRRRPVTPPDGGAAVEVDAAEVRERYAAASAELARTGGPSQIRTSSLQPGS